MLDLHAVRDQLDELDARAEALRRALVDEHRELVGIDDQAAAWLELAADDLRGVLSLLSDARSRLT
jgi:hypothetical protein